MSSQKLSKVAGEGALWREAKREGGQSPSSKLLERKDSPRGGGSPLDASGRRESVPLSLEAGCLDSELNTWSLDKALAYF